jgi:hypothetical protein
VEDEKYEYETTVTRNAWHRRFGQYHVGLHARRQ